MKNKGFTLIELLAVIVIMGILMLVAIPAISRTIENSRRDTFLNTAKGYINAIKNAVAADELECGGTNINAVSGGKYYYIFKSDETTGTDLMEQGGKSSWGKAEVKGVVVIDKEVDNTNRTKYTYSIALVDVGGRGIESITPESSLARGSVLTSGQKQEAVTAPGNATAACNIIA